ncbi:beta-mannosidase [Marinilongibacter aquaticus]|uniref:glycoside hydrolase family 2 protein n=1 Tax=Marinilongibacter aquaticus TaxID=2975157 RepID=UPI0021BDC9FD|nr:glycoside hydrolase family 2 protein [Marinilongibacter aquaticus]UBM59971.1 beta-mannosidase [Marinilongibacter aquaticus]
MKFLKCLLGLLFVSLHLSAQIQPEKNLVQPFYISPRGGTQHTVLDGEWQLGFRGDRIGKLGELDQVNNWVETQVPGGTVHWSLFRAGKFPNMYEHLNSKLYEWVEDSVWYYKRSFDFKQTLGDNYAMLVFDGVDYFSRVWLNGTLLGKHEGMFGGPAIEVGELLKPEGNELIVEVCSGKESREKGAVGRRNPKDVIKGWEFTGGVGAEPFYTVGMWQGVRLEIIPKIHLERPFLITNSIEGTVASLQLKVEVFADKQSLDYELHPWSQATLHKKPFYGESLYRTYTQNAKEKDVQLCIEMTDASGGKVVKEWPIDLFDKRNWINKSFEIPKAKLWWPNGMGEPNLYKVSVSLKVKETVVDRICFDYGIRTIETRPSAGPQVGDFWDNWQFEVNGEPFFLKGVNWMPADVLLDLPYEKYDWLIQLAKNAGVQMFRIWGSGLIETENFYKACNKAGIMVWSEYSMANWDAPEFPLEVFESQVMWSLFRLRNHPSLAVHSGGNEYNPYSKANSALTGILERSVEMFDGTRPFRRASPDEGSIHTYPDMDPTWYQRQYEQVPFIAESGMHSITEAQSLYEVIDPKEFKNLGDMYSDSFKDNHPEFLHHFVEFQANRIPRMLSRASHIDNMQNPSLESIAEASQIGAGEFYQVMSDLVQANYPVTTGLLPWVFKRPWPVVSAIHLVDGFGQPSAPYYFLKRTYEPTHVMVKLENLLLAAGETIPLELVVVHNGKKELNNCKVEIKVLDAQFKELFKRQFKAGKIVGHSAVSEMGRTEFEIPSQLENQYLFVVAELSNTDGKLISRSIYWPRTLSMLQDDISREEFRTAPKAWPILEKGPWLKKEVESSITHIESKIISVEEQDGRTHLKVKILNSGKLPAFNTTLNIVGEKRCFYADDNYFWLDPGEERVLNLFVEWRETKAKNLSHLSVQAWNTDLQTQKIYP